jgi:DNA polymerase (family 10)
MADLLEFRGENTFKVNAHRRAARTLNELAEDVAAVRAEGRLRELTGIGEALAKKIEEYLDTRRIAALDELAAGVPESLLGLMTINGLGPKRLAILHRELAVIDLVTLKGVLTDGRVAALAGFGEKSVGNLLRGIELHERHQGRMLLGEARALADSVIASLRETFDLDRIEAAGSLRRMQETIGDVDILVASRKGEAILRAFTALPFVRSVLGSGDTKGSILTDRGRQVDLRVVEPAAYGAALHYFTGSKAHNVKLRGIAKDRGLKVNEYGVYRGGKRIAGKTEEEVYASLGLPWIPPELREDRGEIEAAYEGTLPALVDLDAMRGDLHVHTLWSDGTASLLDMVRAARERGLEYVAITDHSVSATYANGLTPERLRAQTKEIEAARKAVPGIRVLQGGEVDIRRDGTMDYPDEVLDTLDWVIGSIHSFFTVNVTERILKAMENPRVDMIAHPTGRLLFVREAYEVDLEAVFRKAKETGTAIEVNSHQERLDLADGNVRRALDLGCRLVINTDSHSTGQLAQMPLGIGTARRGWARAESVVNTYPPSKIRKRARA